MTVGQKSHGALHGISPQHLGARSPLGYVNAITIAEQGEFPVFPCATYSWLRGSKALATTNVQLLRSWWEDDPTTQWRVRADQPTDGLNILHFPAERVLRLLCEKLGSSPPNTWTIERGEESWHLFARGILEPEFALERSIASTAAMLHRTAMLPGCTGTRSTEKFRWRDQRGPGEVSISCLSREYVNAIPKKNSGIGLNAEPDRRAGWHSRPDCPLWSGPLS